MVVPPGKVLDEARAAAKQGDYAVALEKYERFFDRALVDQGEDGNYYGVRLCQRGPVVHVESLGRSP